MIRVILSWLGWAFIAFGLLEIAYEIYVMLDMQTQTINSTEKARKEAYLYWQNTRSEKLGNGFVNLAMGAIMVGVYQLLIKADRQNVTPMKAKKDLGNWPPSVQGLTMKQLILILSLSFGLASPAFALKAGKKHPEPYKVMTKGQVIGQMQTGKNTYSYLLIAYQGEIYKCSDYGKRYNCILLAPDGGQPKALLTFSI